MMENYFEVKIIESVIGGLRFFVNGAYQLLRFIIDTIIEQKNIAVSRRFGFGGKIIFCIRMITVC